MATLDVVVPTEVLPLIFGERCSSVRARSEYVFSVCPCGSCYCLTANLGSLKANGALVPRITS